MAHGTFPVSLVIVDAPETPEPSTDALTSLLAAAGMPVSTVRVIRQQGHTSAEQVLFGELDDHLESYVAGAWSTYKAYLHQVVVAGGTDGGPVPFHVASPLCRLDEEAVALVCETWREAFALGMSLARSLATGGVAVRLPETTLCPRCVGYGVETNDSSATEGLACPECDGDGVVDVTPDLLVLGGAAGVLPLPVRVLQT